MPFQFDDYGSIVSNQTIRDIGNFVSSFDASGYNSRRLIGYLSFALNYHFGGLDTVGYHVVNLAIHILNAVLVYFLVVLTFRTPYFRNQRSAFSSQQSAIGDQKQAVKGNNAVVNSDDSTTQQLDSSSSPFTIHPPKADPPVAGDSRLIAFFSALFFVVHPIQTQAVTYIVQRFTSLSALFYLLSVVMYIKGRLVSQRSASRFTLHVSRFTQSIIYFLMFLVSAVFAMKTKETAFTLPAVILLYEFSFFKSSYNKRRLLLVVSAAAIAIPLLLIKLGGLNLSELSRQTMVQATGSRWVYFMTEMRVIVTYIRLIFLPVNQNIDYDYPLYDSFFAPPVFLSFLFLAAVFGAAVYLLLKSRLNVGGRRSGVRSMSSSQAVEWSGNDSPTQRLHDSQFTIHVSRFTFYRLISFGIFWFFITLSIESSIIPIADVIFEHRVYLPSVGFFIALVSAVFALAEKFPIKARKAMLFGMIVIAIVFGGLTYMRNKVWQSPISLWEDAARKSPGNMRPLLSLAEEYAKAGRYEEAIGMYRKALTLPPRAYLNLRADEYPKVYNALGLLYAELGRYGDAIAAFRMIPKIDPDFLEAYNNMAAAYINSGRYADAIEPLKQVTERKPDYADAHYNLSVAYLEVGNREAAMKEYIILKRLSPQLAAELSRQIMGDGKNR